jgi:hypothetical protein
MREFQSRIEHVVQAFVVRISEIARHSVATMTEAAFAHHRANGVSLPPGRRVSHSGRPPGVHSSKRSTADLEAISRRFVSFVRAHPGLRIEQINALLGTTTYELALPIRKSIAQGLVSTKGAKRSTKYFASEGNARN